MLDEVTYWKDVYLIYMFRTYACMLKWQVLFCESIASSSRLSLCLWHDFVPYYVLASCISLLLPFAFFPNYEVYAFIDVLAGNNNYSVGFSRTQKGYKVFWSYSPQGIYSIDVTSFESQPFYSHMLEDVSRENFLSFFNSSYFS